MGDRLLSAVIPYEESGWYDGQMWVKPPEVSIYSLSPFLLSKVFPLLETWEFEVSGTGTIDKISLPVP